MGLYHPKLEPGERLVWCHPAPLTKSGWLLGTAMAAAVGAALFAAFHWFAPEMPFWSKVFWVVLGYAYILLMVSYWNVWYAAVTDRRLVVRRVAPWSKPRTMALDKIELVYKDIAAYKVVVRGGGREIRLYAEWIELDELKRVLGKTGEGA